MLYLFFSQPSFRNAA